MTRDLSRLFAPRSVAVVGGGAWCANVIGALQRFGFEGAIWPVHPSRPEVGGLPAVPSVADLPGAPDAAFVGVNHRATLDVVADLARAGAGGAIAFASGFGEVEDAEAQERQARLVAAAGDMPVIGPNCYGFVNALDRVALWPDQHGLEPVQRGVAILTQSSNIAINLTMQARGLPIAAIVTVGNQAQLGLAELGMALLDDPRITALGLHIEGIGDLPAFERLAGEARRLGKRIVVIKAGRSAAAQAATLSHTASLAGSSAGASALFVRLGCAEADTLAVFLETLKLFHVLGAVPEGPIASMSCSGGEASLIADTADRVGRLVWQDLTQQQRGDLQAALGPRVTIANPLDYHTYIWNDVPAMTAAYAAMMRGPQALTCLVADFPCARRADPADWQCIVEAAQEAQAQTGGRLALVSTLPETMPDDVAQRCHAAGIVTLAGMEEGMRAIRLAMTGVPQPEPAVLTAPAPHGASLLDESAGKDWLAAAGIAVPARASGAADAVVRAAQGMTGPLVLKGLGLAHKSEAGAVVLGLGPTGVAQAAARIDAERFLVEEQITDTVAEVLVGVVRDPAHGFVLTLGAGGVLTEIWRDTVSLLVPASRDAVDAALDRLKIGPVLRGFRGRPAADRDALLDAVMALQAAVTAEAATLEEVEINPLIVTPGRAVAVDVLIRQGRAANE